MRILYASQEAKSLCQENFAVNPTLKYSSARLYPHHLPPPSLPQEKSKPKVQTAETGKPREDPSVIPRYARGGGCIDL